MDKAIDSAVVHAVEDDEAFRTSLVRLLTAAGHRALPYGSTGEFLLGGVHDGPGCLLLDFHLPGPSGLDLQAALAKRGVSLPVIFVSGRSDVPVAVRAMKAGALDFLTKPVRRQDLLAAVQKALALDSRRRAARAEIDRRRACHRRLTVRERAGFDRIIEGKLNKVIAAELGMAERTVKAHRAHIMSKMGARSLAELVHFADQLRTSLADP